MRFSLRLGLICVALAAAAIAAGCGGDGGGEAVTPETGITEITPPDASLYADAVIKPEGDLKDSLDSFLSAVLDTDSPGSKITGLIDERFQHNGEDKTFADDVEPWLGDEGGVFTIGFADDAPALTAVQSEDPEAGVELLSSASANLSGEEYKGVSYEIDEDGNAFGAIGDFVALGDRPAFKAAIDASDGESLANSDRFRDAVDELPSDALGRIYGDVNGLVARVAKDNGVPESTVQNVLSRLGIKGTFTAAAQAGDKRISLDVVGVPGLGTTEPSKVLGSLPSDAWLAVGVGDFGGRLKGLADRIEAAGIPGIGKGVVAAAVESQTGIDLNEEVFPWLGDAALFIRGTDPDSLEGALVLESTDDAAAAQTVDALRSVAAEQGLGTVEPLGLSGEGAGFTIIRDSDTTDSTETTETTSTTGLIEPTEPTRTSQPINVVQQKGRVIIALGDSATAAALTPIKKLEASPAFAAASGALGDDGPAFFVSAKVAIDYLAASAGLDNPDFKLLEPYLKRLSYLTVGNEDALEIILGAE